MRKKVLHITKFLLLPLAVLPAISAFLFQLHERAIKHHMEEELKIQPLQTIAVAEDDFYWMEPGKEIWVQGHAFDIETVKYEKGLYVFTGLFDEEETYLITLRQKSQEDETQNGNKSLVEFLYSFQAIAENQHADAFVFIRNINQFGRHTPSLCSADGTIIIPPPKASSVFNTVG